MNISGRKIEKIPGKKPEYVFDIIRIDPEWIAQNNIELTKEERDFYQLRIKFHPTTDVRLDVDELKELLSRFDYEILHEDVPLQEHTSNLFMSIQNYNARLKKGFAIQPFESVFNYNCPYDRFWDGERELYPNIGMSYNYVYDIKRRLQGLRQKYKNGKLSHKLYDSAELLRANISDMETAFRGYLIEYGKKLHSFFLEWEEYRQDMNTLAKTYAEFASEYRSRGTMNFGKFKGRTVGYVIRHDLQYIEWALKNKMGFTLKGDDLTEFIEKAGYDPTEAVSSSTSFPSDETIGKLASALSNSGCELNSVVFKLSKLPDTKTLMTVSELFPLLKYSIRSFDGHYYCTFSGEFEINAKTGSILGSKANGNIPSDMPTKKYR